MILQLGKCIDSANAKEFINTYLLCLNDGYQLSTPIDDNSEINFQKWEVIIGKIREEFSDEFCKEVAQLWQSLLTNCNPESPTFEEDMLLAAGLNKDMLIQNEPPEKKATTEYGVPKKKENSKDPFTTPAISEKYQQRQLAEAVRLPEIDKLNAVYNKAFKSKDAIRWLITHLTFSRYDKIKPIPRSTVPPNIREQWEEIIAKEFNTIASDDFLSDLTNEWFYLVNQKGIPVKPEQMEEVLMILLSKQQKITDKKNPPPPGKPKKGIFYQLFGK